MYIYMCVVQEKLFSTVALLSRVLVADAAGDRQDITFLVTDVPEYLATDGCPQCLWKI